MKKNGFYCSSCGLTHKKEMTVKLHYEKICKCGNKCKGVTQSTCDDIYRCSRCNGQCGKRINLPWQA